MIDANDIYRLSRAVDKTVRITTVEGEIFTAKVILVEVQARELIHKLISTSTPERYKRMGKALHGGTCLIPFDYISRIETDPDASE